MKILQVDEATNPGNIGGYKNTPFTGNRPVWNRSHQREPGSYADWNKRYVLKEGFFDDLKNLATASDEKNDGRQGVRNFEEQIEPHTADELYKTVCVILATRVKNDLVNKAAKLFLPLKSNWIRAPKNVDEKLFEEYRDKIEDAVIEYCTEDAIDIVQRIRKQYGYKGVDGEMIYGTILQNVMTGEYDLVDNVAKLYNEFVEYGGYLSEDELADEKKTGDKPSGSTGNRDVAVDKLIRDLKKVTGLSEISDDSMFNAMTELLQSDFGVASIKQWFDRGGK